MKTSCTLLAAVFTYVAPATSAAAATITGCAMPVAGQPGQYEVNVYLNTDGPPQVVSFDLTFQGVGGATINNILGFGQAQTRESQANIPDQFDPNYKKANDSWFDDVGDGGGVNTLGFVVVTPTEGPNFLSGGLATDVTVNPPQSFQYGRIAHLILTAGSPSPGGLRVTGSVAVGSAAAQAVNVFPVLCSEPASGTMTALALLAFRRKRSI